jgi:hypothetical protein
MSYVEVCQKHGQYHGEICGDCYEGLKEENARLRDALEELEWLSDLPLMSNDPARVKARAALEGK